MPKRIFSNTAIVLRWTIPVFPQKDLLSVHDKFTRSNWCIKGVSFLLYAAFLPSCIPTKMWIGILQHIAYVRRTNWLCFVLFKGYPIFQRMGKAYLTSCCQEFDLDARSFKIHDRYFAPSQKQLKILMGLWNSMNNLCICFKRNNVRCSFSFVVWEMFFDLNFCFDFFSFPITEVRPRWPTLVGVPSRCTGLTFKQKTLAISSYQTEVERR